MFLIPAIVLLIGARAASSFARADPDRRSAWRWLAAAAGAGALTAALAGAAAITGAALVLAFYGGALASVLLLGAALHLAVASLGGVRPAGLLDTAMAATVALALVGHAVLIPGLREGDPILTAIFGVDLLALLLAGTTALAAPSPVARAVARAFTLAILATTLADGHIAVVAIDGMPQLEWLVAGLWMATGLATMAAGRAFRRPPRPAREPSGARFVAGRVLIPFLAAAALPAAALSRAALPGFLPGWEYVYFGFLSTVVLALAFARQGHLLLDNLRAVRRERALREEAQRRNEELEALTALATTMTQTLEETPILEQSLEVLHLAARATGSALFLARPDGGHELAATAGAWTDHPPGDGDPQHTTRLLLAARGSHIGTVVLTRPREAPLEPASLDLLRLLVDQLAVAVQNARDYRDRLEQAIRDPLTGLYNRRYLFEALEQEVKRTERYGTSVSLAVFDVDDFKVINDTFGHAAGDDVLRGIAAVVSPLLRPTDSFARFGGEEFAVLLPETQQLDALLVADRLRTAIARAGLADGRRVTVSGGVASCPGDATSREGLLRRADAALYWAKRNGKDICAVAGDAGSVSGDFDHEAELTRGAHLYGLVASIDGQTRYTRDHSENVAAYATALGRALELDGGRLARLRRAALLHDIGKVAVPVGILSKPGRLDARERAEIERHATVGATMVLRAGLLEEAAFVRHHHERYDGGGYPDRIAGEAIPFESRILFVADSFEAMTSDRAYRDGMSAGEALAELRRCVRTQFDPVVVEALAGLLDRGELPVAALRV